MKRARILQPVNENTFITYTNYQNLLEQPDIEGGIGASGGTDSTFNTRAFLNGGTERIAASIDGGYATTDGPKDGSGLWGENGLARLKWAINRNNELLFEGLAGHRHEEDLSVWQNGDAKPGDYSDRGDYWSFYTGYHWRQGAGNHLLVSFQTNGSDARGYEAENGLIESIIGPGGFIPWTSSMDSWNYRRNIRGEVLEMLRFGEHRISLGGAWNDTYYSVTSDTLWSYEGFPWLDNSNYMQDSGHQQELRAYVSDIWKLSDNIQIDAGLSWCKLDGMWYKENGKEFTRDEVLPHLGVVLTPSRYDSLRFAYFQELQPNYLSGTLQQVEVAGFQSVTGVQPGTWTWFYGAGWDRQWSDIVFSRFEIFRRDKRYPTRFNPWPYRDLSWKDQRETTGKLTIETLLTKQFAVSLTGMISEVKAQDPSRRRMDYEVGLRATWVHQDGWKVQGALWFSDQREGSGYDEAVDDNFVVLSFSIEKSLFDKHGLLFLRWENITDQQFKYILREPVDATQLPWQDSLVEAGFYWTF
jgi:hypothetical protein